MKCELDDIYVEEDEKLLSAQYKHFLAKRLAKKTFDRKPLSRQTTTTWVAKKIQGFCEKGGKVYDGEGEEIIMTPTIFDDAYFNDASHSWNSAVRRFARKMPKRNSSDRILLRLQLLDAAFRIEGKPIEL